MRYDIEFETSSETKRSGAVEDPQGPSRVLITWDATVRLEVLGDATSGNEPPGSSPEHPTHSSADPARPIPTPATSPLMRVRTTYERSSANVKSDTPDPQADDIEAQYARLEGKSVEFTLAADGHVSNVSGLAGILTDQKALTSAEQWMAQLSGGASGPAAAPAPGQKWTSEEPAASLPLAGMFWRTQSTYLRNENCHPANPAGGAPVWGGESCAVILSKLSLVEPHPVHDATPPDYRSNGLHTSGHWSGSSQSLSYVSLKTGWVVSVAQNGSEQMDVTVLTAYGSSVHYSGTVATRSQISLIAPEISQSR